MGMPFISENFSTTILVRPHAIAEHSIVSITCIEHGFMTVLHRYNFLHKFARGPCESITRRKLLADGFMKGIVPVYISSMHATDTIECSAIACGLTRMVVETFPEMKGITTILQFCYVC